MQSAGYPCPPVHHVLHCVRTSPRPAQCSSFPCGIPHIGDDAIVVGSGISGGWAAKELTEKGLRVLLLERGKNVEHIKDYVNATKGPWEYPHRGGRTQAMEEAYPVLKRDYPLNEKNLDWWASDQDSPYTEVKRFDWFRGYQVGGRSLMWGRQSYRWATSTSRPTRGRASPSTGRSATRDRALVRLRRALRRHLRLARGLPQLPDGQFQPPMPLNCGEELIAGASRGTSTAGAASSRARREPHAAAPGRGRASTATPAGSAAPTAPTSARSPPRCRRRWRPAASR
jgi:hypothetical protein